MRIYKGDTCLGHATTTDGMDALFVRLEDIKDFILEIEDEIDVELFNEMWNENQCLDERTNISVVDVKKIRVPCSIESIGRYQWFPIRARWERLSC